LILTEAIFRAIAQPSALISVLTTKSCLPASSVSFKLAKVITPVVASTAFVTIPSILFPSNSAYTSLSSANEEEGTSQVNLITIFVRFKEPFLTVVENLTSSAVAPAFSTVLEAAELAILIEAESVI